MNDHERIELLNTRLSELERRPVLAWEQPIAAAARRAIENELSDVGRRLVRRLYATKTPAPRLPARRG